MTLDTEKEHLYESGHVLCGQMYPQFARFWEQNTHTKKKQEKKKHCLCLCANDEKDQASLIKRKIDVRQ